MPSKWHAIQDTPAERPGGIAMMGDKESLAERIRRIPGAMWRQPRSGSGVIHRSAGISLRLRLHGTPPRLLDIDPSGGL